MHEPVLDSLDMFGLAASLPDQVEQSRSLVDDVDPGRLGQPDTVLVIGSGAAGLAGDAVAALVATRSRVPVLVHRGVALPSWVASGTLVVVPSPDGDSAAAVETAEDATARGATVVAVTDGGRLKEICENGVGIALPVSSEPPVRALLGTLTVAPLMLLDRAGLVSGCDDDVDEAVSLLRAAVPKLAIGAPRENNRAYQMALALDRRFPLVIGSAGPAAVAAHRWKSQVNANAKAPSSWAYHPEALHDELAGFGQHGDVTRQLIALVELRHGGEAPEIRREFEVARSYLEECVATVEMVRSDAGTPLGAFFDLVVLGDFASLYLAALATVDPGPAGVPVDGDSGA